MDNTPINLEIILQQAPHWTFAGDYTLLQWMSQISQDLESRAIKTTESLSKLNHNVRSTNIALDNVANSLTALQFGNQFVECRVQDDDETLNNISEASGGDDNTNPIEQKPTPKEMLNTFLNNNLKVLRNCHEKFSIDLEDSDDDEIEGKFKEKTCIYQPINPYNRRPLPYIFNSKDWHANWHVGLYENHQDNNYSGDELSEAFSESSSTSRLEDNESLESNTEWASSNSIDQENLITNIENRNASSLRGSQQIYPGTPIVPISAVKNNATFSESSSHSTPSSSLAKKPIQSQTSKERLSKRSESINSFESKNSQKISTKVPSHSKEKPSTFRAQPPPFVDLFSEPPEDIQSTTSSSVSSAQNVNTISEEHQISKYSQNKTSNTGGPDVLKSQAPPFVDLFAEPPSDIMPSTSSSSTSSSFNSKRKTVNLFDDDDLDDVVQNDLLLTINENQELAKPENNKNKLVFIIKNVTDANVFNTYKTPKSLFEDSDEDDFLKEFVSKQSEKETTKPILTKTLLFDNDTNESENVFEQILKTKTDDIIPSSNNSKFGKDFTSSASKEKSNITNLFDSFEDMEEDSLFTKNIKKLPTDVIQNIVKENERDATKISANEEKRANNSISGKDVPLLISGEKSKITNLFNDVKTNEEDLISGSKIGKESAKLMQNPIKESGLEVIDVPGKEEKYLQKSVSLFDGLEKDLKIGKNPIKQTKTPDIFNDLDGEDGDDLFSTKPKQTISNLNVSKSSISNSGITDTKILLEETEKSSENIKHNLDVPSKQTVVEENIKQSSRDFDTLKEKDTTNRSTSVIKSKDIPKDHENSEPEVTTTHLKEEVKVSPNESNLKSKPEPSLEVQSVFVNKEHDNNKISNQQQSEQLSDLSNKPNSQTSGTKYEFNSILFMDEPPEDDNDFFESLTTTTQTNISNYNVIDLENDLYEPELPKVPAVETNKMTNPTDIRKATTYTGLHLFSDIPPDDDNDPVNIGQGKRLQGVFYDDLNETLEALNSNEMSKSNLHSLFSNESPPINNELNVASDKSTNLGKIKVQKKISTEDSKLKNAEISIKVESVNVQEKEKTNASNRPVSKLLMPNININVQALLPGCHSTSHKLKEGTPKHNEASNNDFIYPAAGHSYDSVCTNEIVQEDLQETKTYSRTAETEHILPNVTKYRVKGPATRRPSTRRARQENYRKSLIEEQKILEREDDLNTTLKEDIFDVSTNRNEQLLSEDSRTSLLTVPSVLNTTAVKNSAIIRTEIESNNKNEETPKKSENPQPQSSQIFLDDANLDKKSVMATKTLLFEDESDDDLFNNIKSLKSTKKEEKSMPNSTDTVPEKLSLQTEFQNIGNIEVTKGVPLADDLNKTELGKVTSNSFQEISAPSVSGVTETKTEISNQTLKPVINKTTSSFFDDEDNVDEDLFKPTIEKAINQAKLKHQSNQAKLQFKSFLDSESEKEENVADLQTTKSTLSTTLSESTKTKYKSNLTTKEKSKQLFSDSDTDSDDLFGKLATTTKTSNNAKALRKISTESSTKLKISPKTSLFSDVSDDDDADFLKTSKKSIQKPISKCSEPENRVKVGAQENMSLFSDIDSDEDDLFGSIAAVRPNATATNISNIKTSTSKPTVKEVSKTTNKNPTKQMEEISKTKTTIADNPLADLL